MTVDTAEFARITETVERLDGQVGALSAALEAAYRYAGVAAPWRRENRSAPRHARPRGNLRLVEGGPR